MTQKYLKKLLTKNRFFVFINLDSYQGMRVFKARYYGSVLKCHTGKILDLIINIRLSSKSYCVLY